MANLYQLRRTLLSDHTDINASYRSIRTLSSWQGHSTWASRVAPKFEPLHRDMDTFDEDWNEFNDINKVIIRQQIRTEYKVGFPHPYNSLPRSGKISPYRTPKNVYVRTGDPNLPAFYSDAIINPISLRDVVPKNVTLVLHEDTIFGPNDEDEDDFELPDEVAPFLEDKELENDRTADAIALRWAHNPYNRRPGRMRWVQDILLVKNWYLEHCPPTNPLKSASRSRSC